MRPATVKETIKDCIAMAICNEYHHLEMQKRSESGINPGSFLFL